MHFCKSHSHVRNSIQISQIRHIYLQTHKVTNRIESVLLSVQKSMSQCLALWKTPVDTPLHSMNNFKNITAAHI